VSIAFAASVPFIFLAFYQDKIASWLTSSTKEVVGYVPWWLKKPLTIALLIGVALTLVITLSLVWTRPLASSAKVAVTIAIVLLVVVSGICFGIYGLYIYRKSRLEESRSGGETGSLVSD
jgi:uncharacterized membrane-anchored protein